MLKRYGFFVLLFLVTGAVVVAIWSAQQGVIPPAATDADVTGLSSSSSTPTSKPDSAAFFYQEELVDSRPGGKLMGTLARYAGSLVRLELDDSNNFVFRSVRDKKPVDLNFQPNGCDAFSILDQTLYCAYYHADLQCIVVDRYDKNGRLLSTIPCRDSQIEVRGNQRTKVREVQTTPDFIYLLGTPTGSKMWDLEVYDLDGNLVRRFESVRSFCANGSHLLVSFMDGSGTQLFDLRGEEPIFKTRTLFYMSQFSEDGRMVYGLDLSRGHIGSFSVASEGRDYTELVLAGIDMSYIPLEEVGILSGFAFDQGRFYLVHTGGTSDDTVLISTYAYSKVAGERPPRERVITVTIPYMTNYFSQAMSRYELNHPDVDIVPDYMYNSRAEFLQNHRNYATTLSLRIASGEAGDLVMIGGAGLELSDMLSSDAFLDLSDRIRNSALYPDLIVSLFEGMRVDGAIRGVPLSFAGGQGWYILDEELLRAIPGTDGMRLDRWIDVLDLVPLIEEYLPEGRLIATATGDITVWRRFGGHILYSNIDSLIDFETKTVRLDSDWFRELLRRLKDLSQSPAMEAVNLYDIPEGSHSGALFTECKLNEGLKGSLWWYLQTASGRRCRLVGRFGGEIAPNRTLLSRMVYGISAHSSNQDVAWDFLEFLLSPEIQRFVAWEQYPVNRLEYTKVQEELKENFPEWDPAEVEYATGEVLRIADSATRSYDYGLPIRKKLWQSIEKYMNDELTLEAALTEAEREIRILLNE